MSFYCSLLSEEVSENKKPLQFFYYKGSLWVKNGSREVI